jgi:TPR repeat protein
MVARCEKLGGSVCLSLAWAYRDGLGTAPDSAKGSAMEKRACDTGSSYACFEVAQGLAQAGRQAEARAMLLKACNGDIEQGCALAAAMTKPADGPEARQLLTRGCALGMPQSCDALGGQDDASQRSACESGGVESCATLAFKLGNEAEHQHKWDLMEEAIGLLQKACRRGSTRSCNVLGHVARDAIRACDADNGPQCLVAGFPCMSAWSEERVRPLRGSGPPPS